MSVECVRAKTAYRGLPGLAARAGFHRLTHNKLLRISKSSLQFQFLPVYLYFLFTVLLGLYNRESAIILRFFSLCTGRKPINYVHELKIP